MTNTLFYGVRLRMYRKLKEPQSRLEVWCTVRTRSVPTRVIKGEAQRVLTSVVV